MLDRVLRMWIILRLVTLVSKGQSCPIGLGQVLRAFGIEFAGTPNERACTCWIGLGEAVEASVLSEKVVELPVAWFTGYELRKKLSRRTMMDLFSLLNWWVPRVVAVGVKK